MCTTLDAMQKAPRRWLLWRSTPEGRKIPLYANGELRRGTLDRPEDIAQLVSYQEAVAALKSEPCRWSGMGFALGPDDNGGYWQGIDFNILS